MLTDQELQSLRNLGNESEAAADEICKLRDELRSKHQERVMNIEDIGAWHRDQAKYLRQHKLAEEVAVWHDAAADEIERQRSVLQMIDAHYSGSLDHQPAYVRSVRALLNRATPHRDEDDGGRASV